MCGRYVLSQWTDVLGLLGMSPGIDAWFEPRFNIAPTQIAPIFLQRDPSAPLLRESMRWGLIPHWAKDRSLGARCINARSETIHEKPSFRDSFRHRRCLVPATGFYEWRREGRSRLPYFVHRDDGAPLLLAGLWSSWRDRITQDVVESFAIVTQPSAGRLAQLHDRSPVYLEPENVSGWVAPESSTEALHEIVARSATSAMVLRPVRTEVNSVHSQGPDLVREAVGHGVELF